MELRGSNLFLNKNIEKINQKTARRDIEKYKKYSSKTIYPRTKIIIESESTARFFFLANPPHSKKINIEMTVIAIVVKRVSAK